MSRKRFKTTISEVLLLKRQMKRKEKKKLTLPKKLKWKKRKSFNTKLSMKNYLKP